MRVRVNVGRFHGVNWRSEYRHRRVDRSNRLDRLNRLDLDRFDRPYGWFDRAVWLNLSERANESAYEDDEYH